MFVQEIENKSFGGGIDLSCRFVRQEHTRAGRQGDGKACSRQFAARQLPGTSAPSLCDADTPQQFFCPRRIFPACQQHRQFDVVANGQGWEQVTRLHQHANTCGSSLRSLCFGKPRQTLTEQLDVTAIRFIEAREASKQGRFPAARWPHQRHHLAGFNPEADTAQSEGLGLAGMEEAVEVDGFEDSHLAPPEALGHQ
ncbi:hypothetical protein ES707_12798 [subsurface metagenome]